MKRVVCCPAQQLPIHLDPDALYFATFERSMRKKVGYLGLELPHVIRSAKLAPSVSAWDFATIAFAVDAADKAVLRSKTADGWTRMIDLTVALVDPAPWAHMKTKIEQILGFLTGDFWALSFVGSNTSVPVAKKPRKITADCVCLLSGGADSLVGAIDLISRGRTPLFVSQKTRGSVAAQVTFANTLGSKNHHFNWGFVSNYDGISEKSTRARSIVFFAFAVLAASSIGIGHKGTVEIVVPENGFISLNVPLGSGRIGSLSTKTTHPIYMLGIQDIWNTLNIHAKLCFPYKDKTKGELFMNCANQKQLIDLIDSSVSCGKYQRHALTHCGECIPCLIRRAAFLKANLIDTTKRGYLCSKLKNSESEDVAAAAVACIRFQTQGLHRFIGGALSFAPAHDRLMYENVVERGLQELSTLLSYHGVV